jgi:PAS domain S-box-containing protein
MLGHEVRFYGQESFLLDEVARFFRPAVEAGEPILVIATPEHRRAIASRLWGLAGPRRGSPGPAVFLDAQQTLDRFLVEGRLDPALFASHVGGTVRELARRHPGRAWAYGEMVALLAQAGRPSLATELEAMWNGLAQADGLTLLCAYPISAVEGDRASFLRICDQHGTVGADTWPRFGLPAAAAPEGGVAGGVEDFLEQAVEGIHQLDPDGIILWANQAELDLLGYGPHEYVGRPVTEFAADPEVMERALARLRRGDTVRNLAVRLRCKDGTLRHVLMDANARFEGGRLAHSRCFMRDATELVRLEESRHTTQLRLRLRESQQAAVAHLGQRALAGLPVQELLQEAATLAAKVLDMELCQVLQLLPDGRELLLLAGTGWAPGLVGSARVPAGLDSQPGYTLQARSAVVVEDLATETRFPATSLLQAHGVASGMTAVIEGRDGPWGVIGVHTTRRTSFTPDDTHFVQAVANVLAAAIERQRSERESAESEHRLRVRERQQAAVALLGQQALRTMELPELFAAAARTIAETMGHEFAAVLRCDPETREVELVGQHGWGAAALGSKHRLDADTQVGYTLQRRQPVVMEDIAQERRFGGHPALRAHGIVGGISVIIEGRNGEPWGVLSTHGRRRLGASSEDPYFLEAIANVLAAAIERGRAEDELRAANEELRDLDRKKTEFINLVAHELRTPLTPIMMRLQMIQLSPLAGPQEHNLRVLERNLARLNSLVDQLLDIARQESGTIRLDRQEEDLSHIILEAAETFRTPAAQRQIELVTRVEPGLRAVVQADRIVQVVVNLLSNALKFSQSGGRVEVRARLQDGRAVVEVEDGGAGFTEAQHRQLFKRFSQPHGPERGGYGLGLHVSRMLIEQHGGRIEASSAGPGQGACFRFWLPASPPRMPADAPAPHAAQAPAARVAPDRVALATPSP